MKSLKSGISIAVIALLMCTYSWSQPVQSTIVVTCTDLDYTPWVPEIGIVNGTYEYHFSYKLDKSGTYIESIRWNARNFNLTNQKGEKVIVIDSGHDSNGMLWGWFNYPNEINGNIPEIVYSCPNHWLDDLMTVQPAEGVAIEMSCKVLCKGKMMRLQFMSLLHIDANGVTRVDMIKP